MVKSYWKDILRDIKHYFAQFISIVIILSLGMSFYIGIQMTGYDMRFIGQQTFQSNHAADLLVTTTQGMGQESLLELKKLYPQAKIETVLSEDTLVNIQDQQFNIRFMVPQETLNQTTLLEGRYPESENEIVLDDKLHRLYDVQLGQTVLRDSTEKSRLTQSEFKIVGFVSSINFIDFNRGKSMVGDGMLDGFGYVIQKGFNHQGIYNALAIAFPETDQLPIYSDGYSDFIVKQKETLIDHKHQILQVQRETIVKPAQEELEKSKQAVENQLSQAQQQLDEGQEQLNDAQGQLQASRSELQRQLQNMVEILPEKPIINANLSESLARVKDAFEVFFRDSEETLQNKKAELLQGNETLARGLGQLDSQIEALSQQQRSLQESLGKIKSQLQGDLVQVKSLERLLAQQETSLESDQQELILLKEEENELLEKWSGLSQMAHEADEMISIPTSLNEVEQRLQQLNQRIGLLQQIDPMSQELATLAAQSQQLSDIYQQLSRISQQQLQLNHQIEETQTKVDQTQSQVDALQSQLQQIEGTVVAQLERTPAPFQPQKTVSQGIETSLYTLATYESVQYQQLQNGIDQVYAQKQKLINQDSELKSGLVELNKQQIKLAQMKSQVNQGLISYTQGLATYQSGLNLYQTQIQQLEKEKQEFERQKTLALKTLDEHQAKINEIESPSLFIQTRNEFIEGYQGFRDDSLRIEKIGSIFPLFFFLIASLISLSTLTRMVLDQKQQMGIYRALGLSKGQVQFKFIGYALAVVLISTVISVGLGFFFIPTIIYNAYRIMYQMPALQPQIAGRYLWIPVILSLGSTVGVAWMISRKLLKQSPSQLLRATPPKTGKRIFIEYLPVVWNRFNFLQKITLRNLARNQSRFWMTIFGVAGCCSLLMTGFGLRDSIMNIPHEQFNEINRYDGVVVFNGQMSPEPIKNIVLEYTDHALLYEMQTVDVRHQNNQVSATVYIFENTTDLVDYIHLKNAQGPVSLGHDGVVLSAKMAELLEVGKQDEVILSYAFKDLDHPVEVSEVADYYVGHAVYMTKAQWIQLEQSYQPNSLMFKGVNVYFSQLSERLLKLEMVHSVVDIHSIVQNINQSMDSFYIVIIVVVCAAALLAFVVMFNLSSMNLSERQREIATLKVLGFTHRETSSYLLRESILLIGLGTLVGIGLGYLLHHFVIMTAEIDKLMFVRSISGYSVLFAGGLTILFSLLNEWWTTRRIRKIDMLSALKSVE